MQTGEALSAARVANGEVRSLGVSLTPKPLSERATIAQRHAARVRAALRDAGVDRLEDRPCVYCEQPIGNRITTAYVCSARECQLKRIRQTNVAANQRYRKRRQAADHSVHQSDPIRDRTCARCEKPYRSRNRLLCQRCHHDDNRAVGP